jgi:hypothetical protein
MAAAGSSFTRRPARTSLDLRPLAIDSKTALVVSEGARGTIDVGAEFLTAIGS